MSAPTIQLDPDALEAARKAAAEQDNPGTLYLDPYYQEMADAAITAFIAAIEPKLREKVNTYAEREVDCLRADNAIVRHLNRTEGEESKELSDRYDEAERLRKEARTELFALLGLEVTAQ